MSAIIKITFGFFFLLGLVSLLVIVCGESGGETIIVSQDGSSDHENIQDAIDNATEGDTIRVWEGTYEENVVVNKTVSLVGNGSETTTIDGGGEGDVVRIEADWCNVSLFSVTGGGSQDSGIKVGSNKNNIFENNCSNNDFGIYLENSGDCTIENNICSVNGAITNGYGIYLKKSNGCSIANNTCSENNRRGIYLYNSDTCTIENNTCSSNSVYGIILKDSSDCTIERNTCSNNDCGISLDTSRNCTLSNNTCYSNNWDGIYLNSCSYCTIKNNSCNSNKWRGIILCNHSNHNTLSNNTISENRIGINLQYSSRDNNTAYHNDIYNNTEYGINTTDSSCNINATLNWWGDTSGPYHPTENPEGEGDNITDHVIFDPWLTKPVNRPPTANAGDDQTINTNEEVQFLGIGEDPDGTIDKYEWDFNGDGTFDWSSSTTGETTHSYPLEGTYHAVLRVTDDDGATATNNCKITVNENIKPTVNITSHANHSEVSGTVTIMGITADADSTIEKVEISIDDGYWEPTTGTTSWSYQWNTTTLENGEYSLKFRAFDGEDFSEIVEITLNVQKPLPGNQKPTVSITNPKRGEKVSGTITISGSASDPDGTVEKVEVSINGGEWQIVTGITNWNYTWDTTKEENGEYTIQVRAFDGKNYSEEKEITVKVENKEDGGAGGFIPGFGAVAVVGAIGVVLTLTFKKRRKED